MAEEFVWPTATPDSQGLDGEKLEALKDSLAGLRTRSFLVIRNDRVVYEWYSPEHSADHRDSTASMAKALLGGVCLAVAIDDGRIGLDDRVAKYVPRWADDAVKATITIRQLGSHTSGLEESAPKEQGGWKQVFWERQDPPHDPFTMSRDEATMYAEPGSQFYYSNPGIAMLGYALTAAIQDGPEKDLRTMLRDRVMRKIGVPDEAWSVGYGQTFEVDGLPLVAPWGGGGYTARAAARVGRLMLHKGNWEGVQLISARAVEETVSDAGLPGGSGMGWWTNGRGRFEHMPRDAYWAAGAGDRALVVIPSLNMICVRNGQSMESEAFAVDTWGPHLLNPLMDAVIEP